MSNDMFDFSHFELSGDRKDNFSKNNRGAYKSTKVITPSSNMQHNKPIVYENRDEAMKRNSDKNVSLTTDIGAIANAVSGVITAVGNIITSFNMVSMEKEITKQAKIQARVFIEQEKQASKRFITEQREQTKRLKETLRNDYKMAQLNLIGTVKKLEQEEREMKRTHEFNLLKLKNMFDTVKDDFSRLDKVNDLALEKWEKGEIVEEQIIQEIREIRKGKLEIIKLIAQIK